VDFNVFEGQVVTGLARTTVANGKVVWDGGVLKAMRGAGRYVERPRFVGVGW
jgi:dihydropyrimidinase